MVKSIISNGSFVYLVMKGHKPGFYFTKKDALEQIKGFKNPFWKKFKNMRKAKAYHRRLLNRQRAFENFVWNSMPINSEIFRKTFL